MTPRGASTVTCLLLLAASERSVVAEDFQVSLTANREVAEIAQPVTVTFTAHAPVGWRVILPELPDDFGDLKIIHTSLEQDITNRVVLRMRLEAFAPGRHRVALEPVRFRRNSESENDGSQTTKDTDETVERDDARPAHDNEKTLSVDPLSIRVRSSLGLFGWGGELREISGKVFVPWTWKQWLTAFAVILTASVVLRWLNRKLQRWLSRRRTTQQSLLLELERLDERRLQSSLDDREVVLRSAELLRESLAIRAADTALHRTTNEWSQHLRLTLGSPQQPGIPQQHSLSEAAVRVLATADGLKYAGREASMDDARRCVEDTRWVISALRRSWSAADSYKRTSVKAGPAQRPSTERAKVDG